MSPWFAPLSALQSTVWMWWGLWGEMWQRCWIRLLETRQAFTVCKLPNSARCWTAQAIHTFGERQRECGTNLRLPRGPSGQESLKGLITTGARHSRPKCLHVHCKLKRVALAEIAQYLCTHMTPPIGGSPGCRALHHNGERVSAAGSTLTAACGLCVAACELQIDTSAEQIWPTPTDVGVLLSPRVLPAGGHV